VEVAALMPWLSATALLHTMLLSEHGGNARRWNVILTMITFLLVVFGTFVTRSGLISSVHAFAISSLSYYLLGFMLLLLAGCITLVVLRWKMLAPEELDDSILSRQTLFQIVNLLFLGILAVCLWGLIYPSLALLFLKKSVSLGPSYYKAASGPLFIAILVLMGICPLLAWERSNWKKLGRQVFVPLAVMATLTIILILLEMGSWQVILAFAFIAFSISATLSEYFCTAWLRRRTTHENIFKALWNLAVVNRRHYGGYLVHLGVMILAIGIIGIEFLQTQTEISIKKGELVSYSGYSIQNNGITFSTEENERGVALADFTIVKNGKPVGRLSRTWMITTKSDRL